MPINNPEYWRSRAEEARALSVDVGEDGRMNGVQAEIEGFLGLGTSSVRFASDKFEQKGDRIVLSKRAEQVRGVASPGYQPLH